jgi:TonB family protein
MKYPLRFGMVTVCLVSSAFLFAQSTPSSTIRSYRHELFTRSQESKFASEISPAIRVGGTRYEVETDTQGRTTRVAVIRDGQTFSERFYRFATSAKLPHEYERFVAGEKIGVVRIQRDEAGNRIREDYFTVGGTLTRYELYSYSPDYVEDTHYTAEGKKTRYEILHYSANDTLTRVSYHSSPDIPNYVDTELDDGTGLWKSRQGFKDGKLSDTSSFTYNADDDLVRADFYNSNHKWYSADEFDHGLRTRRIYQVGGATRELQYTYDEKRWLKESALYYKETLVCRFVYDRLPDGTAKQTRALGPNGELWAEYPDAEVSDVKINGEALAGENVIHKTSNWWNASPTSPEGGVDVLTDTQGVDFGPYVARTRQIVRQNWYTLMPPQVYPPIFKQGKLAIEFEVLKDGTVSDMKLRTSSGDVALDRAAWGSITASAPFPPLPKEFPGKLLGLRFYYFYNLQPDEKLREKPTDIIVLPGQEIQLATGAKQKFSVTVPGAANSTVIWSVSGPGCAAAACGSISDDGIYAAPLNVQNPATVTVIATLAVDPTKTGSATVHIQPIPSR